MSFCIWKFTNKKVWLTLWPFAGFLEVGGFESLKLRYMAAVPDMHENASEEFKKCAQPSENAFHLFRGLDDPLPWPGMIFGILIVATWYWCSDQVCSMSFYRADPAMHAAEILRMTTFMSRNLNARFNKWIR